MKHEGIRPGGSGLRPFVVSPAELAQILLSKAEDLCRAELSRLLLSTSCKAVGGYQNGSFPWPSKWSSKIAGLRLFDSLVDEAYHLAARSHLRVEWFGQEYIGPAASDW